MIPSVYIASTLSNAPRVRELRDKLAELGISLTYDWSLHCRVSDPAILKEIAIGELRGIIKASVLLLVAPGKLGTHFEYGVAFGAQKPVVFLADQLVGPDEPIYHLDDVFYCYTETEAISTLQAIISGSLVPPSPHLIQKLWDEQC